MSVYEQHRLLYQVFAAVYAATALLSWHLLTAASRADPNRLTVQQLLLMLASALTAGRVMSFVAHLDWQPPAPIMNAFTAATYTFGFGLNSVLLRFVAELLQSHRRGSKVSWGLSFLYPAEYLSSARGALLYFNLVLGIATYAMLTLVQYGTAAAPLVAVVGSLVHTVVYFSLGCEAASCVGQFRALARAPSGSAGPERRTAVTDAAPASSGANGADGADGAGARELASAAAAGRGGRRWGLQWPRQAELLLAVVAACLLLQGSLTTLSVVLTRWFFDHFAVWQSIYLGSELLPAWLLLAFLGERPSHYLYHIAPAA